MAAREQEASAESPKYKRGAPQDALAPPTLRPLQPARWFRLPVPLVAWGLSLVIHAGLLSGFWLVKWRPFPASKPQIHFPRGDRSVQVTILSTRWPKPGDVDAQARTPVEKDGPTVRTDVPPPAVDAAAEEPEPIKPPDQRATPDSYDEEPEPVADAETDETQPSPEPAAPDEPAKEHPPPQPPAEVAAKSDAVVAVEESSSAAEPGVQTGVKLLTLPRPEYPPLSRRRGEEGLVLLKVEVLPEGRAGRIEVLRDPGFPRLTAAAVAAARRARFRPATRDGRPVRAVVRIPFRFVLH